MHLVMFDIDGTLTTTFKVDEECYVTALKDVFGFERVNTDWAAYRHASDSAILHELCETRIGRCPSSQELQSFQARFFDLLASAAASAANPFSPIPGAQEILLKLQDHGAFAVSIATGGWRKTANFKLSSSGLKCGHLPAGYSDDAHPREEIMKVSCQRACQHYGVSTFDSIIYVGDGVWDLRASRNVNYHFLGIGLDARAVRLKSEGARHVFPDYLEEHGFFEEVKRIAGLS